MYTHMFVAFEHTQTFTRLCRAIMYPEGTVFTSMFHDVFVCSYICVSIYIYMLVGLYTVRVYECIHGHTCICVNVKSTAHARISLT